jgi:hypothetical protein
LNNLYENYDLNTIQDAFTYSFLAKQKLSQVYVTAVDSPKQFYIQNVYSNDLLIHLNQEINIYLNNI